MPEQNISVVRHTSGGGFQPIEIFSALATGSAGLLILGLQPVLLGALLSENRVDFDGLALIATIEILAIGIGSAILSFLFSSSRMRIKAVVLLALTAVGHFLTADAASLSSLMIIRGVTGLLEGGLVAIAVELVARAQSPGRIGGWFVVIQTLAQSVLAALLAILIVPHAGSAGGFQLLAAVTLLAIPLVYFLRSDYGPMPEPDSTESSGLFRLKPMAALLAIFTLYLFIGAIWAFLEPLGALSGLAAPAVGLIVSITLLVQVAGASIATLIEEKIRYPVIIGGAAVAAILISFGFATAASPLVFWFLALATGFLWLFVVPWQIGMTVAADSSRKAALLVPAAQLFGAAIGPIGATAFMSSENFRPVAWFGAGAAAASLAFLLLLLVLERFHKKD